MAESHHMLPKRNITLRDREVYGGFMKKNFVIMLAVVLMISVLIGCGNRIDEKFIPSSTFYSLEGNSLAISVEWPAVNGQKNLSAAPPAEFNIGTIEIVLINLTEWQEFSEEYNLEEMEDSSLLSHLSYFFIESENVIVKSYDVKPESPNRDGAQLNDIKTGTYILYIAGIDADTSLTTFFALKENIIVADDKTTKVTVTSSDWLGDTETGTETGGENGYILNVLPSNSTYVLSPEPDNDGYYEEGTVVTVTAAPEAGNHFCYFKYSGQSPFLGSVLPNSTTITMNSDKILNIVSSPGEYVVYVSDDNGNDLNNGLNPLTPVKTPEKAVEIVDLIIAENSGQVAPAPSMAGGLALEVGIEVRLEGSLTGQTSINNNPEKEEVF